MPLRIAFFGLGEMGFPMAGRLVAAGYVVAAHDVAAVREAAWRSRFGGADIPLADAQIVVTCVTDEPSLMKLLLGADGLVARAPGTLFIDHTTISVATARAVADAAVLSGALAVDAPASGGREGAETGRLSIMLGGSDAAVAAARPVLACYAAQITHLGPPGAGQMAKLANQVAIAGIVRGLAEAVMLARADGLAVSSVLAALAGGSAGSVQLDRLAAALAEPGWTFDRLFAWLAKDLHLATAEGKRVGAALPMTELVSAFLDRGPGTSPETAP